MTISYKLTKDPITGEADPSVHKTKDGKVSFIPFDPANKDYQDYLKWVDEGNTAEAAD